MATIWNTIRTYPILALDHTKTLGFIFRTDCFFQNCSYIIHSRHGFSSLHCLFPMVSCHLAVMWKVRSTVGRVREERIWAPSLSVLTRVIWSRVPKHGHRPSPRGGFNVANQRPAPGCWDPVDCSTRSHICSQLLPSSNAHLCPLQGP